MTRPGRNELRLRLARHYLEICDEASRLLRDGRDLSEITKDVPNILQAQIAVSELANLMPEAAALCWQFPFALGVGGASLLGLARAIQWNEAGLAIAQKVAPGQPRMQVELQLFTNLGYLFSSAGELTRSRDSYQAGYWLAQRLNRPQRVAELAGHLGETLCELGDYPASSRYLEQSRDTFVSAGPRQHAWAEFRLGRLHHLMGQPEIALEFIKIAADISAVSDLEDLWPMVVGEVAAICEGAHRYSLAINLYERILETIGHRSNPQLEGRITAALGDACFYANQLTAARTHYGKAIAIFGRTGDKVSDGRTQGGIGAVLAAQGNFAEALGYFKLSIETAMKCGDGEGVEKARRNIGALCAQLGDDAAAGLLRLEAQKILDSAPRSNQLTERRTDR